MTPQKWHRAQRVGSLLALTGAVTGLTVLGGLPGLAFGLVAVVAWLASPPVFAFVFAQAGLAAVTSSPYTLPVLITELAIIGLVLSDAEIPIRVRPYAFAVTAITVVASGVWVTEAASVWTATLLAFLSISILLYGGHRYELLTTGHLEQ